jgi:hypothetical protein
MAEPFRAPAAEQPLIIDKGLTFPFFYTVKDSGTARDLTGYLSRFKVFSAPGGTLLLDAAAYITLGGTAGTVSVKIPDEITAALTWREAFYVHDLETPAGEVVLRLYGPVSVQEGKTT